MEDTKDGSPTKDAGNVMQTRRPKPKALSVPSLPSSVLEALRDVAAHDSRYLIESDSAPSAVLLSLKDYERLLQLDEADLRLQAQRRYRQLEAKATASWDDLTEEEIEDLTVYVGREINERVYQRFLQQKRESGTLSSDTDP